MFLPFRLHLVARLFLIAFWILFVLRLVLFRWLGVLLTRGLGFVLLGLWLGFFLSRRFIFLRLVFLRVGEGCTPGQHCKESLHSEILKLTYHPPRQSLKWLSRLTVCMFIQQSSRIASLRCTRRPVQMRDVAVNAGRRHCRPSSESGTPTNHPTTLWIIRDTQICISGKQMRIVRVDHLRLQEA